MNEECKQDFRELGKSFVATLRNVPREMFIETTKAYFRGAYQACRAIKKAASQPKP